MGASFALALAKKYLPQILGAIAIIALYFYWHHAVFQDGYNTATLKFEKRDADTERKGKQLLMLKQHEADIINKDNRERLLNATKIYADHYANLHANPVIERVFVNAKTASCSGDSMPGSDSDRSKAAGGTGGTGKAELSETANREFSKVIDKIEDMQLKCELLLNQIP